MIRLTTLTVIAVALGATAAQSAPVTKTYDFMLGGFTEAQGQSATPPYAAASGSFTVSFDPTQSYNNATAGLTVNSYSGPALSSPFGFDYISSGQYAGTFQLGGTLNNANYVATGTDDFILTLDLSNLDAPTLIACDRPGFGCSQDTGNGAIVASGYTTRNSGNFFLGGLRSSAVSATAPEPATWAMLVAGFGMVGASLRRRKAVVSFA